LLTHFQLLYYSLLCVLQANKRQRLDMLAAACAAATTAAAGAGTGSSEQSPATSSAKVGLGQQLSFADE
jgi:hypothetical protein